jgi:hypothetical protein
LWPAIFVSSHTRGHVYTSEAGAKKPHERRRPNVLRTDTLNRRGARAMQSLVTHLVLMALMDAVKSEARKAEQEAKRAIATKVL